MILQHVASPDLTDAGPLVAMFLHGYGSNETDLVGLASALPKGMPWVSLRAPIVVGPGGHAWFAITVPGNPNRAAVARANESIWTWVDSTLAEHARIVPIGFSQGGLMASQLLRTDPARVIAPVILGGFVLGAELPGDPLLASTRPAVFSGRGTEDRVIPDDAVQRTTAWLAGHTTPTARTYPGLAHGIHANELGDVRDFLATHLTRENARGW